MTIRDAGRPSASFLWTQAAAIAFAYAHAIQDWFIAFRDDVTIARSRALGSAQRRPADREQCDPRDPEERRDRNGETDPEDDLDRQ